VLAEYGHFVRIARRVQWDADAIDLAADARAWRALDEGLCRRVETLVAGFCVGEAQVAAELEPFAAAADGEAMRACFAAQRRDEARHVRFFDRVAAEVIGVAGATAEARGAVVRTMLDGRYLELFDRRLPEVACALTRGDTTLARAVGLYHMVLEGVVFTAGLTALLALLDGAPPPLPEVHRGVGLVLRDERWHVGFGTRALLDAGLDPEAGARLLAEGEAAAAVWAGVADDELLRRAVAVHRRRLAMAGVRAAGAVA
jgi:ribonucleoside-diphosphate reductase beta chain